MESSNLKYERKGNALLLTFTNPETLNSLSREVLADFSAALTEIAELADKDKTIRSLILTGEGRAFIAGADIKEMSSMSAVEACEFSRLGNSVLMKLENMRLPVIAAVNGFALGGGLEVVLACDFAYISKKARLGLPEATLGIIPGFGGNKRLTDRIGRAAAKELIYTGRMIDAVEAHRLGIANRLCEPDSLIEDVLSLSDEMEKASPNSLLEVKELLNLCSDNDLQTMLAFETNKFGLVFSHPDGLEGKNAFIEKRKPEWRK
ncbi:MAG: enoyl-CoA hydratase/isomerase family protein [Spirochaetales bacterium]|nr:enoyl-CoA hydratase/isomerase family protein [Spirochaetales bacterium]